MAFSADIEIFDTDRRGSSGIHHALDGPRRD
jgi:hypothetical protein